MQERSDLVLCRHEAVSAGGMIATKHELAAEAGAAVLQRGGNAVDAAVTAAFVLGVVEPFMSGLGGGGFTVAHLPKQNADVVIDYSMVSPRRASPEMYRLRGGVDASLFGWPAVEDDANIVGHRAVAVPGVVAGLALALERYGTMTLREAIAPAIRYADDGFPISWHTVFYIAIDLTNLNRFPATRAIFTADGLPPSRRSQGMLRQPELAATLRAIAADGPRAFYEGPIARAIATEIQQGGGLLDEDDLRAYQAREVEPLRGSYRGLEVLATPTASGGPTVIEILNLLEGVPLSAYGPGSSAEMHEVAEACRQAFVDRFAYLADPDHIPVPTEALVSKAYAAERRQEFDPRKARRTVTPGDRSRLGVTHNLDTSEPGYGSDCTTTHVSVIDRDGAAVSLTQTLLSGWGSRVVIPGTGVLLNNGMMWFDPEAGRPNSIAGGKRPVANMAPVVMLQDGEAFLSLGAMGGRRILSAVPQIIANVVDYGMGMQAAIEAPRLDYSTRVLQLSSRLPAGTVDRLRELGHPIEVCDEDVASITFASPVGVLVDHGIFRGGATPYYPAMAIGVD